MKIFRLFLKRFLLIGLGMLLTVTLLGLRSSNLSEVRAAQTQTTGEWTAELNPKKTDEVQMTFHRRSEKGGFSMSSNPVSLSELQGLTRETILAAKTNVNFKIVREAGTFSCEGFFNQGRGAGFWTFTPNQGFVAAMNRHE
jgi:hypothetical protein